MNQHQKEEPILVCSAGPRRPAGYETTLPLPFLQATTSEVLMKMEKLKASPGRSYLFFVIWTKVKYILDMKSAMEYSKGSSGTTFVTEQREASYCQHTAGRWQLHLTDDKIKCSRPALNV